MRKETNVNMKKETKRHRQKKKKNENNNNHNDDDDTTTTATTTKTAPTTETMTLPSIVYISMLTPTGELALPCVFQHSKINRFCFCRKIPVYF